MKIPAASDAKVILLFFTSSMGAAVFWCVVGAILFKAYQWIVG